jgi:hypothetical protein
MTDACCADEYMYRRSPNSARLTPLILHLPALQPSLPFRDAGIGPLLNVFLTEKMAGTITLHFMLLYVSMVFRWDGDIMVY